MNATNRCGWPQSTEPDGAVLPQSPRTAQGIDPQGLQGKGLAALQRLGYTLKTKARGVFGMARIDWKGTLALTVLVSTLALAGCSGDQNRGIFGGERDRDAEFAAAGNVRPGSRESRGFFSLFRNRVDPNVTVGVNKYIWNASLEVLSFLPIQTVDPFSGVIVTGFGRPPGGGRAYRATVLVQDPALEARSLTLSLQTSSGPASAETVRAVEDAILTRARQLRIRDADL